MPANLYRLSDRAVVLRCPAEAVHIERAVQVGARRGDTPERGFTSSSVQIIFDPVWTWAEGPTGR